MEHILTLQPQNYVATSNMFYGNQHRLRVRDGCGIQLTELTTNITSWAAHTALMME